VCGRSPTRDVGVRAPLHTVPCSSYIGVDLVACFTSLSEEDVRSVLVSATDKLLQGKKRLLWGCGYMCLCALNKKVGVIVEYWTIVSKNERALVR
jgi:hypothetical protein